MGHVCGDLRYEDILVCEDVDGKDSLWPWRQGWRVLMPCCSGWRRPGETSTPSGQYSLRPTVRHNTKGIGEQVEVESGDLATE